MRALQELRPLVYPLCQVLIGAVRLVPTPCYFPLHLRLIRALINLGGSTGSLVPIAALLLDMLHWSALSKPIRAGTGNLPQNMLLLRASKATLATSSFQADIVEQVRSRQRSCMLRSLAQMLTKTCVGLTAGCVSILLVACDM